MDSRTPRSRRWFLVSLSPVAWAAAGLAADPPEKGRFFPPAVYRYSDPATEFPIARLTDPAHTSVLPAFYNRAIARRSNFLIYSSDMTGRFQAFRMDLKTGQSRQLTDAENLDPASLTLIGDGTFCYLDGGTLFSASLSHLRARLVYRIPEGFERAGVSIAEDGQYGALIEKKAAQHRLQLIQMTNGETVKLAEANETLSDPMHRPRRASVLYRRAGGAWLVNYDAQQNYRLRLADGATGPAQWSPDGRSVFYLNYPSDAHKLHNLREFVPDTNEDRMLANTTQYVQFGVNRDASVFVGASGSKASPYVLLLVRAVKREMTLAEHRSKDAAMVAPVFAPNSQRVFFGSDRHGHPAIYTMSVEKLVEATDSEA